MKGIKQTLLSKAIYNRSICQKKEKHLYIYRCWYSKDVHIVSAKHL